MLAPESRENLLFSQQQESDIDASFRDALQNASSIYVVSVVVLQFGDAAIFFSEVFS
jgi:hypothetical protein